MPTKPHVSGSQGNGWGRAWIWISLVGLIVLVGLMGRFGSRIYGEARKLSGLPYMEGSKLHPPLAPASAAELDAALALGNPMLRTLIGFGGIVIIAALMMFKPF